MELLVAAFAVLCTLTYLAYRAHIVRELPATASLAPALASSPVTVPLVTHVDDVRVAVSGILSALCEMRGGVTRERQRAMLNQMRDTFGLEAQEAREFALLGAWAADAADTPDAAVYELSQTLRSLDAAAPGDRDSTTEVYQMAVALFADRDGHLPASVDSALRIATRAH